MTVGVGENLFKTALYGSYRVQTTGRDTSRAYAWKTLGQLAEEVVQGWLSSPPHRRNLLGERYDRHGLGVQIADDRVYVTQVLC